MIIKLTDSYKVLKTMPGSNAIIFNKFKYVLLRAIKLRV